MSIIKRYLEADTFLFFRYENIFIVMSRKKYSPVLYSSPVGTKYFLPIG